MKRLAAVVGLVACPLFGTEITQVYADAGDFVLHKSVEQTCEASGGLSVFCSADAGLASTGAIAQAQPGHIYVWTEGIAFSGSTFARAFARDESSYIVWGSGPIETTGAYLWFPTCCYDTQEISQNGTTPEFINSGYTYVTSTVEGGVPFSVILQASVSSVTSPNLGSQRSDELRFVGFFDRNGRPIPYSFLPEPGTFLPIGAAITVLAIGRKRRRYAARPKCV